MNNSGDWLQLNLYLLQSVTTWICLLADLYLIVRAIKSLHHCFNRMIETIVTLALLQS